MTEKEKMQAGEWFSPNDEELVRDRARARHLTHRLNVALKDKDATYLATLRELCPRVEAMIRAPFHCDYGYNISIGKGSYVNFNCVFLALGPIRLGQRLSLIHISARPPAIRCARSLRAPAGCSSLGRP